MLEVMQSLIKQKSRPMTAAERQRICRAKKRGTYSPGCIELGSIPGNLLPNSPEMRAAIDALMEAKGLPRRATAPQLPAPPSTEIVKPESKIAKAPARAKNSDGRFDQLRLSLPPAVAARLTALLDRHEAGEKLTEDELAEARGLLDIAEYFVVQRMRNRLAA